MMPTTRPLAADEAACAGCGYAIPRPADSAPNRVTLEYGRKLGWRTALGNLHGAEPPKVVVMGHCHMCAPRYELWSAWKPKRRGEAATLAVATRLLNFDGDPDEVMRASGLLYHCPPDVLHGLRWLDRVRNSSGQLVGVCNLESFGHVTLNQLHALAAAADQGLKIRDASAARSDGLVLMPASSAANRLNRRAEHVVDDGCGSCGREYQIVQLGTLPEQVWHPIYAPVQAFTQGLRRPGAQVGYVSFLLCEHCHQPVKSQGATVVGKELAHCLLPDNVYRPMLCESYAPGVLTGALFVGAVLRARVFGQAEPVPSADPWGHLRPQGSWVTLPLDPNDEGLAELAKSASGVQAQAANDQAARAYMEAEIDRRATEKARDVVKTEKQVAASKQSMTDAVTHHKAPAKTKVAKSSQRSPEGWMRM